MEEKKLFLNNKQVDAYMGQDQSFLTLAPQKIDNIEHNSLFEAGTRLYDATPIKTQAVMLAGNALDQFFGSSGSNARDNQEKKKNDEENRRLFRSANAALFNFETLVKPGLIAIGLNGANEMLYVGKRQLMDRLSQAIEDKQSTLPERQELLQNFNATLEANGAGVADTDMITIDEQMAAYLREHGGHVETIRTPGFSLNLYFFGFSMPGTTIYQASVGTVRNARNALKKEIDEHREEVTTLRDAHANIQDTDDLDKLPEKQRQACHGLCSRNRLQGRTAGQIMETGMTEEGSVSPSAVTADRNAPSASVLPALFSAVVVSMSRKPEEPQAPSLAKREPAPDLTPQ